MPLCLLTPDLQTRRIIDGLLASGRGERRPTLESDSTILLLSHVRTGQWASILPTKIAQAMGPIDPVRAIPIIEPDAVHTIGLVVATREPMTPLNDALVVEARRIAASPGL